MYVHAVPGLSTWALLVVLLGALAALVDGMRTLELLEGRSGLVGDFEGITNARTKSSRNAESDKPISFDEFLNSFSCHAMNVALKFMYFHPSLSCANIYSNLKHEGLFAKICAASRIKKKTCYQQEKKGLCSFLKQEVDHGRLDNVTFAMWGASVGFTRRKYTFDEPDDIRSLKKMYIPGWNQRSIAYDGFPEHDKHLNNMESGGVHCMLRKIRTYQVHDDLDDFGNRKNLYANRLTAGAGNLNLLTPTSSADVHFVYFDRFGIYVPKFHFPVPQHALMSDAALEMLVFQSMGAHRVMPIGNIETFNLNLMGGGADSIPTATVLKGLRGHERQQACFYVKLEEFYDAVPVRKGMQRWGGNAFFDAKFKLVALQYGGQTILKTDSKWEETKFVFRSSLVSTITAYDHLTATHMISAGSLAMAMTEELPGSHPLRRILTPHTWGTLAINFKAATNLYPRNMLVHRASPFTDEAFEGHNGQDGLLWAKIGSSLKFLRFRVAYQRYSNFRRKNRVVPEIPFFEDGYAMYQVLKKYVRGAVHIMYSSEPTMCAHLVKDDKYLNRFVKNFFSQSAGTPEFWPREFRNSSKDCSLLVDFLTEMLFLVTGWHRHVGTVADFFRDTRFVATSWKKGETEARPKQSVLMMLLASSTFADYPTLSENLNDIYNSGPKKLFHKLYEDLHTGMKELQSTVEKRNAKRKSMGRLEFHQMEPRYVEWGVEV